MPAIDVHSYGGATVRRRIDRGGSPPWLAGHKLSAGELQAMPVNNLRALIDNHTIEPWPAVGPGDVSALEAQVAAQAERIRELETGSGVMPHLVHTGRGLWEVILGRKLTDAPVPKETAEALAAEHAAG